MKTLYISDVDGTLYRGGEASLRDQTRELFSRLLQTGTAVTIASGRNLYGIYDIATESGITLPVIAYNGAAVYDFHKGKAVKIFPMEREKQGNCASCLKTWGIGTKPVSFLRRNSAV